MTPAPALLATLPALLLSASCVDTSDPPPEVVPIEVVARTGSPAANEPGTCEVSRETVTAGVHETFLFAEGGPATIRVLDPSGTAIVESRVDEGDGATSNPQLDEGDYVVECAWSAGTVRAALTVVPSAG
jgi:hypothetical protein